MRTLLALVCLVAVNPVSGLRKRRGIHANSSSALISKQVDCASLGNIVVGGRDLGQAATLLCRFWPAKFGDFPVTEAKTIADLFNKAGDLWAKVKELAKGRPGDSPFCWKKMAMRDELSRIHLDKLLHVNSTELALSASSDCEMDILGVCYGSCPMGMKPMTLVGSFAPMCTSSCMMSDHDTPCGFGCASGVGTCFQTLADQVAFVTNTVGKVASFLTGNPIISEVVDKVMRLVEFAVDVVLEVVRVAKHVFSEWPREEATFGVIITLLQFVLEHAKEIGQDFEFLNEMFGETMEMILELVDTEFDWKEIDLGFIGDTILKHGSTILDSAFEFAEVFVFPTCNVTSSTNPDYDCNGDGSKECGDWEYTKFRCGNGGECEYRFKFGDLLLDHSCRCQN